MTPAIDMLMQEHRFIEQVLTALERCAQALAEDRHVDRAAIRDFGDFFANFADKCHHAKEEDRLFVRMVDHGFSHDAGPIAMMLVEHTESRRHVSALRRIGAGTGPLAPDEGREVVAHARAYAALLREHILKEDQILYPMAESELPAEAFHELMQEFERFETEGDDPGEHRRLRGVAAGLTAAFPA